VPRLELIPPTEFTRVASAGLDADERLALLADMCRANALVAVKRAGSGHLGSTFSSLDLVAHLLWEELNVAELGFDSPDRDVFFSSKGHDVPGLYAALNALGVVPTATPTSASPGSRRTRARSAWASPRRGGSPGRSGISAVEDVSS
jgi:transketolase